MDTDAEEMLHNTLMSLKSSILKIIKWLCLNKEIQYSLPRENIFSLTTREQFWGLLCYK